MSGNKKRHTTRAALCMLVFTVALLAGGISYFNTADYVPADSSNSAQDTASSLESSVETNVEASSALQTKTTSHHGAMYNADGTKVSSKEAKRIRKADAGYPLAGALRVYDSAGKRRALADVDPATYDGFIASVDTAVSGWKEKLQDLERAGAVTSSSDGSFAMTSLEQMSTIVDEDDLVRIEPNYYVHLCDVDGEDTSEISSAEEQELEEDAPESGSAEEQAVANISENVCAEDQTVDVASEAAHSAKSMFAFMVDDPLASDNAGMFNLIDVQRAWDWGATGVPKGSGKDKVVVAVIDTGLVGTGTTGNYDIKHEDLDYSHVLPGKNFAYTNKIQGYYHQFVLDGSESDSHDVDTPSGQPEDSKKFGHGTFCAGEIIAAGNNDKGIVGVAPSAYVKPYRVFDHNGEATIQSIKEALGNIRSSNVDVVSMSLGIAEYTDVFKAACDTTVNAGIIVVAAAGNNASSNPVYPAAYDSVIGVSATDQTGKFASYSNYNLLPENGEVVTNKENVFVSAPGSMLRGISCTASDACVYASGTSQACPLVAGAAALVKSIDPSLNQSSFKRLLATTSTDAGETGYDRYYGHGIVNYGALVANAYGDSSVLDRGTCGSASWFITSDFSDTPKNQLVIYPTNRVSGQLSWEGSSAPWCSSSYAGTIKGVSVAPGVKAGSSVRGMFRGLSACENIDLSDLDASAVQDVTDMFDGCELTSVSLGATWKIALSVPQAHTDSYGHTTKNKWQAASDAALYPSAGDLPLGVADSYTASVRHDPTTSWEQQIRVEPTCTVSGYERDAAHCTICNKDVFDYTKINPLGHDEVPVAGRPSTCNETGLTDGTVCTRCGEAVVPQREIPLSDDHLLEEKPAVAPTCTTAGTQAHWRCSRCGALFADAEGTMRRSAAQLSQAALGHNWNPSWTWSSNTSATLVMTCGNNSDEVETRNATKVATSTSGGLTRYTATASFENKTYASTRIPGNQAGIDEVRFANASFTYNGNVQKPQVVVVADGAVLTSADYDLSWSSSSINAGTHEVTVKRKGYSAGFAASYTISPLDMSSADIKGISTCTYTGSAIAQKVSVVLGKKQLSEDGDYRASYNNNTNAGTASLTITGTGNYTGRKTVSFSIAPASISQAVISGLEESYTYMGESITPEVSVDFPTADLKLDKDYKILFEDNDMPGEAKVIVKGIGNYTGTVFKAFTIQLKTPSIKSLKKAKKAFKIKVVKQANGTITGYQVRYKVKGTSKWKTKTYASKAALSKTVSGLKSKKTYKVQVRTYKKASGKTAYSEWSKEKSIKTK